MTGELICLTDSLLEGLNPADLTAPVALHYPSRKDQKPVPATLMVDKNLLRDCSRLGEVVRRKKVSSRALT